MKTLKENPTTLERHDATLLSVFPAMENAAENIRILQLMGIKPDDEDVCRIFLNQTVYFSGTCTEPGKKRGQFLNDVTLNIQRDESGVMTVFLDGLRYDRFFERIKKESREVKSAAELAEENRRLLEQLQRMTEINRLLEDKIRLLESERR